MKVSHGMEEDTKRTEERKNKQWKEGSKKERKRNNGKREGRKRKKERKEGRSLKRGCNLEVTTVTSYAETCYYS
jgi:hypothetical protein